MARLHGHGFRKCGSPAIPRKPWMHLLVCVCMCLVAGCSSSDSRAGSGSPDAGVDPCGGSLCSVGGWCHPKSGGTGAECGPDATSCGESWICRQQGECWLFGSDCAAIPRPQQPCESSCACKKVGACTLGADGKCQNTNDADLKNSEACSYWGYCATDGATEATCQASQHCTESGYCHKASITGRCIPLAVADCVNSKTCKESGACAIAPGEHGEWECVVPSTFDCSTSAGCAEAGRCHLAEFPRRMCVASSVADCLSSAGCKLGGRCAFDPVDQICYSQGQVCHP